MVCHERGEELRVGRLLDAVLCTHPATGGYVSLRATATDRAGNAVDQTKIRAYGLSG
jgi:hypothetical protein